MTVGSQHSSRKLRAEAVAHVDDLVEGFGMAKRGASMKMSIQPSFPDDLGQDSQDLELSETVSTGVCVRLVGKSVAQTIVVEDGVAGVERSLHVRALVWIELRVPWICSG